MADLHGRTLAFLEARRAGELASLITRHNGVPLAAPCLAELHHPDAPELAEAVDRLCSDEVQVALFLTGVGTETLLQAARLRKRESILLESLARKQVAVRGPKPAAVLRKAGVRIDALAPEPNTSRELLQAIAPWDVRGKTVAVQLYGGPNPELRVALEERGARVLEVQPYAWGRPADTRPVLDLLDALDAGRVDALLATSATQIDNLFAVARDQGRESTLRDALGGIPLAAQGPVCAKAFERYGLRAAIKPEHVHMGSLVLAVAAHFDRDDEPGSASSAATAAG